MAANSSRFRRTSSSSGFSRRTILPGIVEYSSCYRQVGGGAIEVAHCDITLRRLIEAPVQPYSAVLRSFTRPKGRYFPTRFKYKWNVIRKLSLSRRRG